MVAGLVIKLYSTSARPASSVTYPYIFQGQVGAVIVTETFAFDQPPTVFKVENQR